MGTEWTEQEFRIRVSERERSGWKSSAHDRRRRHRCARRRHSLRPRRRDALPRSPNHPDCFHFVPLFSLDWFTDSGLPHNLLRLGWGGGCGGGGGRWPSLTVLYAKESHLRFRFGSNSSAPRRPAAAAWSSFVPSSCSTQTPSQLHSPDYTYITQCLLHSAAVEAAGWRRCRLLRCALFRGRQTNPLSHPFHLRLLQHHCNESESVRIYSYLNNRHIFSVWLN